MNPDDAKAAVDTLDRLTSMGAPLFVGCVVGIVLTNLMFAGAFWVAWKLFLRDLAKVVIESVATNNEATKWWTERERRKAAEERKPL